MPFSPLAMALPFFVAAPVALIFGAKWSVVAAVSTGVVVGGAYLAAGIFA